MKLIKLLVAALVLVCFSLQVPAFAQTCGTDPDGDGVYSRSCNLTDQYAKCSITEEACTSVADCPTGECSERGGACTDAADCPTYICNNGGAACSVDADCPSYGSPGVCITGQTCDAVAQTCDDVATCSSDKHPTEIACVADADCNGICTYTGEPCAETADCSFGVCVTSGATCITSYTCVGDGGDCTEDADCAEVCDPADNCPDDSNPGQADSDGDDIGDACDPETIPCAADNDGDGFFAGSCDLADQYAKCSVTEEACTSAADCPTGECSDTGEACADAADCLTNVCNNGGAVCSIDADCPTWQFAGVCITGQTCDAVAQTCDDVATCSSDKHPTEIACVADADCNGICTYTGEPCAETADCSFGACVTSGATCITYYTCEENGEACTSDADCEATCGYVDNCPDVANPNQEDIDNDETGDVCDNCINAANLNQENADSDDKGDVCDSDTVYGIVSGDIQEGVTVQVGTVSCGISIVIISTQTNASGYYSFGGLEEGRYLLGASAAGYSFVPAFNWPDIPQTVIQSYDFTSNITEE